MDLFKRHLAAALAAMVFAVPLYATPPDQILDRSYFLSYAKNVSAAVTPAPLPRGEFAPITAALYPAAYSPHSGSGLQLLPVIGLQWWVSPNLALVGGLGSGLTPQDAGLTGQRVVQLLRFGLRYLPGLLALGPLTPEITFLQNRLNGLPEYGLKWNEVSWAYGAEIGPVNVTGGLVLMFQSIFPGSAVKDPGVPGKLEATTTVLALSADYDLFQWLRLSVQVRANPNFITGGAQLSLAI